MSSKRNKKNRKKSKVPLWRQKLNAKKNEISGNIAGVRVALLFAVFAMVFLLMEGQDYFRVAFYYDSINFEVANAEIIKSEVTTSRSSKGGTSHSADISYRFMVDGEAFISGAYALDASASSFGSRSRADSLASQYPRGAKIDIYYEKGNPSLSAIKLKGQWWVIFHYVFFGFFLLFSLVGAVHCYKKLDEENRKKVFSFAKSKR